ncbi:hypothetical protein CDAR_242591, partial [Caerostris darwini]
GTLSIVSDVTLPRKIYTPFRILDYLPKQEDCYIGDITVASNPPPSPRSGSSGEGNLMRSKFSPIY